MAETAYELADAHPYYREAIPQVLRALAARYPRAALRRVCLYPARPRDESMGNVNERGVIALNPRWFAADPDVLRRAATGRTAFPLGDGRQVAYHGSMIAEPLHVLTHEFGHVVQYDVDGWERFTSPLLREARADPSLAPAGYALANATEYWAELFAACELGAATGPHVSAMRQLLGGMRS